MKKKLFERIESTAKRFASPMGYSKKEPIKEMTIREMQRRVRTSNQKIEEEKENIVQLSSEEQKKQEEGLQNFFDGDNVSIKFEPILISGSNNVNEELSNNSGVFWAGTIDGQLKFAYMVTPDESTSGVKIERSPDFDPSNEDNQAVEKKIIDYYDTFYDYWSKNQLEN